MPRRPNIEESVELCLCLPLTERAKLDVHLWSDTQQCVPRGAYQKFFRQLLREYFEKMEAGRE